MRQFRTSGSVRGAAREGGPYRDTFGRAGTLNVEPLNVEPIFSPEERWQILS
jgi:hypothetical protein